MRQVRRRLPRLLHGAQTTFASVRGPILPTTSSHEGVSLAALLPVRPVLPVNEGVETAATSAATRQDAVPSPPRLVPDTVVATVAEASVVGHTTRINTLAVGARLPFHGRVRHVAAHRPAKAGLARPATMATCPSRLITVPSPTDDPRLTEVLEVVVAAKTTTEIAVATVAGARPILPGRVVRHETEVATRVARPEEAAVPTPILPIGTKKVDARLEAPNGIGLPSIRPARAVPEGRPVPMGPAAGIAVAKSPRPVTAPARPPLATDAVPRVRQTGVVEA